MCNCGSDSMRLDHLDKVEEIVAAYKEKPGSLITILQQVQDIYNYIPRQAVEVISHELGIKEAKIMGVITFYTQFRTEPIGKHLIMLCQGTACHVNGAKDIEQAIVDTLSIEDGQTTEDGLFTLMNVTCLGCCSLSPVMMIGDETYGKLTPQETKKILEDIKAKEATN